MQVHRDLRNLPDLKGSVLTIGSFDGVHLGHQSLLSRIGQRAADIGTESLVVTFDPHPRKVISSGKPGELKLLNTTAEKIERLELLGIDHTVIVPFTQEFASQTATEYLEAFLFGSFRPHTVVIGYDHRYGANRKGDIHLLRDVARQFTCEVIEIEAREVEELSVSSTRIRESIREGRIQEANQLLGYAYPLTGEVITGQSIGRTIGVPTANLDLQTQDKLLPADGVYAARAFLQGEQQPTIWKGMLYIGERPSIQGRLPRSIEVNLFDFEGDLYGRNLRVEIIAHIRPDALFASLDALRQQIDLDRESTLSIFKQMGL